MVIPCNVHVSICAEVQPISQIVSHLHGHINLDLRELN